MKNILIIGGNSEMAFYFVKMAKKKNYRITLSSKNKQKLLKNFDKDDSLNITYLDLANAIYVKKFIESLNFPFDDIICFSGKLNQNYFDKKNLASSNYLGIKKFINLYLKKYNNLTRFIIITSVAALRVDAKQNVYTLSKKKLRDFLIKKNKEKNFFCNIMPGYTNTKMIRNKNFVFRLLSSSPKYMGDKIFQILEKKYRNEEYIIPFYWIIIVKLYNIYKRTILMFKLN